MYPSALPESHVWTAFVASIALSVIGVTINAFTLFTLATSAKLRQHSTTSFLISLTLSDLLFCAVCLPLNADTFAACHICRIRGLCRTFASVFYGNLTTMMLNQAAVAFNRYITICFPMDPPVQFTTRLNLSIIVLTWVMPYLVLAIPLTGAWGSLGFDPGTATCTFIDDGSNGAPRIVFFCVGLGIPMLIILFCYFKIFVTFKKSSSRVKKKRKKEADEMALNGNKSKNEGTIDEITVVTSNTGLTSPKYDNLQETETVQDEEVNNTTKTTSTQTSILDIKSHFVKSRRFFSSPSRIETRRVSSSVSLSVKEREKRREKLEKRMTMTVFAIFIAFVTCTLPPVLILTLDPRGEHHPELHVPLYIVGWLFGVTNPIIYVCFNKTYRQEYKESVKRLRNIHLVCPKDSCKQST